MSHTKQTPILEYTDAELQSLTVPAGTITHNTTLSCLSYYTGQEWINSDDWESTYTTVLNESASWIGGDYDDSALQAASGNWDSTYTTVLTESANWDNTYTTLSANSADWVTYPSTSIYPEASWVIDEDTFTSNLSSKVPTQQSVKFYVDNIVTGINNLKGGYDAGTDTPQLDTLPTVTVLQGDSYYVTASGDFFATAVDPGDLIIATIDNATLSGDWVVVNRKIQEELIDRWNSTHTTVSTESANWDSTYTTVSTESANWDSTYTTTSANSALWSAGGSTAIVYEPGYNLGVIDNDWPAVVTKHPSGYSDIDTPTPNDRGIGAVDLQVSRQNADQVAGGEHSFILGGKNNKINYLGVNSTLNYYSGIVGGQSNEVRYGEHSIILGGQNNVMDRVTEDNNRYSKHSVACGRDCLVYHNNTFSFNDTATTFETKQTNTFNIHASNGLRLVFDSSPQVGQVLTCIDADGHGKWQSLSADEWNSTYTTVSTESANWDSTYDTVSSLSASWQEGASTGVVFAPVEPTQVQSGNWASLIVKEGNTGYTSTDTIPAGNDRGQHAVDLQINRTSANQIAGGNNSSILGGSENLIASYSGAGAAWSTIAGGIQNEIFGQYGSIVGGSENKIGDGVTLFPTHSFAAGYRARANHNYSFIWSDTASTFSTVSANTFNIHASNGLRFVHDGNDHTGEVLTCLDADGRGKWQPLPTAELPDSTGTVYVSKDGDPSYDGLTINQPVSTISDAITIADNLITAGAYAANIEVLDSGQYIEDITLKDKMTLNAPSAELKGQLTTDNAAKCHVRLGRHVKGAFPATYCVTCGASNAYLYYKADFIDTADQTGILLGTGGYIFADVDEIDIGSGGFGISNAAGGSSDVQVKWLKYTGNTGTAINSTASGSLKVYVSYIGPFGGSNFTNINATAGTCIVDAGQMYITGNAKHWNIGGSADTHIKVNKLTGSTTSSVGTPSSLITGERVDDAYSSYTTVSAESGNWDSTYTTVSSNSATWGAPANTQQTITSSASALTLDVSLGQSATTTLTENITSFTIQNASAGDSGVLIISSDGGGWTFPDQNSLGSSHIVHTGSPDSISTLTSTTSSAVSIGWYCDGSRQFLYISDPT